MADNLSHMLLRIGVGGASPEKTENWVFFFSWRPTNKYCSANSSFQFQSTNFHSIGEYNGEDDTDGGHQRKQKELNIKQNICLSSHKASRAAIRHVIASATVDIPSSGPDIL